MSSKPRRPAHLRAGHMKEHRLELLERANLSRERLAASDLGGSGQAWRLWVACIASTVDNAKAADRTYATTLAEVAGIDRSGAGRLLRRFDELGVIGWETARRASHGISELTLPVTPQAARDASGRIHSADEHHYVTREAALPISNEALTNVSVVRAEAYRGDGESESPEAPDPSEPGTRPVATRAPQARPACCPTHGTPLQVERIGGEDVHRCWECLDASYGRDASRPGVGRRPATTPGPPGVVETFGEPEPSSLTDTDAYLTRRRRQ